MQLITKQLNFYNPISCLLEFFIWLIHWIFIDLFDAMVGLLEFFLFDFLMDFFDLNKNKNKENETVKYEDKYLQEYNDLDEKEFSEKALETLRDCIVEEETEKYGLIKIKYNIEKKQFFYYTDRPKSVPYTTLDVVARKYVIEHDCKCIFVDINTEIKQLEEKRLQDKEKKTEPTKKEDSLFVSFKDYNIKKKNIYIKGSVNNYKYGGTFSELNENTSIKKGKPISFSEYKKNV